MSNVFVPWLAFAGISALYGLMGSIMTTYYGPPATGSGVPELMAYLNGVQVPGFVKESTLLTKVFGVVLAVSGKLCVGKEGPLAHVGAAVGANVLYLPFLKNIEHLKNDD